MEIQTDHIGNQHINQKVNVINDVEEINHEVTTERDYYSQYCQNSFRKQHKNLVRDIYSNKYTLQFTFCNSSLISPRQKF